MRAFGVTVLVVEFANGVALVDDLHGERRECCLRDRRFVLWRSVVDFMREEPGAA
jgi:hypothetical protein